MNIKEVSKKINVSLNTKPEKTIMAVSLSAAMAILTISNRKKKGKPNFIQRMGRFYNSIDKLLLATVASEVAAEEKRRAAIAEFPHKKMRDLKIEDAVPIDLSDCVEKAGNTDND
ncbi:hypothetical protein [uncultured Ruminococcus sp.]|uniref:hypothetical protein n=1 Tax=uncultured Ruminococcus sp. TaxID=165186 RepID=UPI0025FF619B|nr:hypothetical protein [uncultured Ruminococcus sp.]